MTPTVSISLPSTIGLCAPLTLDISTSSGSGGRSWTTRNITVLASRTSSNVSTIQRFLNAQYQISPPTPIPWQMLSNLISTSKDPSKLLLPVYSLAVGTLYTASLTVTIAKTSKSSIASVQVMAQQGSVVARIVGGVSQTVLVNSSIAIDASSSYDEDQSGVTGAAAGLTFIWAWTAEWSVSDPGLLSLSSATTLTPLQTVIPSGATTFSVYLVLAANSLPTGSSLSFSLTCTTDQNFVSTSSVSVIVNAPPVPGTFQVNAVTASSSQLQTYTFSASSWDDADRPIKYQFGYTSNAGAQVVLVSLSEATFGTTAVPSGLASANYMVNCIAGIVDTFGANSSASYSLAVREAVTTSSQLSSLMVASVTVNEIKQSTAVASGVLNTVVCSGAPNCAALNRGACYKTKNTCGSCISNKYVGDADHADSADCSLVSSELEGKQATRLQVLQSIESLLDLEDPDAQSVVAWINSLSEAAQSPDELSEEALSLVLSLSTTL
eukprot:gene38902-biopygen33042